MKSKTIVTVEKEQIPNLRFGNTDVITDPVERKKRMLKVSRATILGNGYHGKVEIFFKTADGESKRVDTTIWDSDQQYLILKSGTSLPVKSVFGIEFY